MSVSEDIAVSIVCNTYNHEKYIKDAINGFLMQKTNFKFEILIHDDCSTDNTANIVKEYQEKYPQIIKPIFQTKNQYSKGVNITLDIQHPRAKGRYFAFCEGDDYWTDPLKLQKQYDLMESRPEIYMCGHKTNYLDCVKQKFIKHLEPMAENNIVSVEDVIENNTLELNSLFYRKELFVDAPDFFKLNSLDYYFKIYGALRGGIYYFDEYMSVYRSSVPNSWTQRKSNLSNTYYKIISNLKKFNAETDNKYEKSVQKAILKYEYTALYLDKNFKKCREEKFKEIRKKRGAIYCFKLWLKATFPFLLIFCKK